MADLTAAGIGSLALLGCGKMGGAMLEGWLAGGLAPDRVQVIEPHPSDWLKDRVEEGVQLNPETLAPATIAVIAVKPQMMAEAAPQLAALAGETVFLSIAAGTTAAGLAVLMPELPGVMTRTVAAAANRSRELAE